MTIMHFREGRNMQTRTSTFGVSKRENHDSAPFYNSRMYKDGIPQLLNGAEITLPIDREKNKIKIVEKNWVDRIYCHSAENMQHIPDKSVALAFTSPPYNVGKDGIDS